MGFEKDPQGEQPERVDLDKKRREYVEGLINPPKTEKVDYNKPRPPVIEDGGGNPDEKILRAEAFRLSKESGEKRSAWQIYEELRKRKL